ncbi:MAG: T9SS type A sorting domain-containing protein [Bacteroidota bacterium]
MKILILLNFIFLFIAGTNAQCPVLITLTTQNQIDNFSTDYPDCFGLGLSLTINGENSDISNLDGLSQLTSLTRFQIYKTNISDFSGFENIQSITTSFRILDNGDLINLEGLSLLQTIGSYLQITQNTELETLEGISGLEQVGTNVLIESNPALQSLSGMENLTTVFQNLEIKNNLQLVSIDALQNLQQVGTISQDQLYIFNNGSLQDLSGLENLTVINGALRIRSNASLISIDALYSLESVSSLVEIRSNQSLSECAIPFICENLSNPDLEFVVENNANNCNSTQEIESACLLSISDNERNNRITFYPNPVKKNLYLVPNENHVFEEIVVYSMPGDHILLTDQRIVDISHVAKGIYLVEVKTNQGTYTRKIVKE